MTLDLCYYVYAIELPYEIYWTFKFIYDADIRKDWLKIPKGYSNSNVIYKLTIPWRKKRKTNRGKLRYWSRVGMLHMRQMSFEYNRQKKVFELLKLTVMFYLTIDEDENSGG